MSEVKRRDAIQGEIIHEYDGIEEADNALPNWWLWIFYGSIVFATIYWLAYQEYGGPSIADEYAAEQRAVAAEAAREAERQPVTDESLEALAKDRDAVRDGRATFLTNCAPCHAERGEGRVGPNLTDRFWINGGAPTKILAVVSKGSPTVATMTEWETRLGKRAVQRVVAYVLSLRNTNVPGKAPQGLSWPEGAPAPAEAAPAGAPARPAGAGQ